MAKRNKWWVAMAESSEAADQGMYEIRSARTRSQAIHRARESIKLGKAAGYAVKYNRSVVCFANQ